MKDQIAALFRALFGRPTPDGATRGYAEGGYASRNRGDLTWLGEREPELVIPESKLALYFDKMPWDQDESDYVKRDEDKP